MSHKNINFAFDNHFSQYFVNLCRKGKAMGKISDFFSITKRERIGTIVALLLLAGAIAFASFSKSWRAQSQAMTKPNQAVMQYLTDSVTVKPDSTSSQKKAKKAKHSPRKKKKEKKSPQKETNKQDRTNDMQEMPQF